MIKTSFLFLAFFLFLPFILHAINVPPTSIEEINKAVLEASSKTKVRSSLLFGLLGQETGYGRNLGRTEEGWRTYCQNISSQDCRNWSRYDCKADYEEAMYLGDILKVLGISKNIIKTSSTCALGFTQFEPKTWKLVTQSKSGKVYSPWNINDSVLIAAYFLQDLGADSTEVLKQGSVLGAKDKIALQKYYCGTRFTRRECVDYAQNVEYKARISPESLLKRDLERQLELLEEEKKRKERNKVIRSSDIFCQEVVTDEFGFGVKPDKVRGKEVVILLEDINRELVDAIKQYQRTRDYTVVKEIQEFLKKRKTILVESFYRNPDKALFMVLLENDRNEIFQISKNCVETEAEIEGIVESLQIDYEDGDSQSSYTLLTSNGQSIILHPALGLSHALVSGVRAKVKGVRIDNELIFNGLQPLQKARDFSGGVEIIQ